MGTIVVGLVPIVVGFLIMVGCIVLIAREERLDRERRAAYRRGLRALDAAEARLQNRLAPPIAPSHTITDGGRDGHD